MKRFGSLILLFLFASCNQSTKPLNPSEKEIIVEEIKTMFDNYHEAIKQDGLLAEFDYLDNSSNFFWVPPGYNSALSYDSVKTILAENSKSITSIEFGFDTLTIYPLSKEIATYTGIVNGHMIDSSNALSTFKIIESGTVIKRPSGWKLVNGQSRNLPSNQ